MKKIVLCLLFLALSSSSSSAHPGNTASDGCHYCRTNCDRWGVEWDVRHCHGGNSLPQNIAPLTSTPTSTPTPTKRPTPTLTITPTLSNQVLGDQIATPTATPSIKPKETNEEKVGFWARLFGKSRRTKEGSSKGGFWNWFLGK